MRGIITSSTTRSKVCSSKRVERLAAVGRLHDVVAVPLQREREQRLDRLLVVDEQDAGARSAMTLCEAEDSRGNLQVP